MKKIKVAYIYILVLLFLSLKMYQSTPLEPIFTVVQSVFLVCTLAFVIVYYVHLFVNRSVAQNCVAYFAVLMFIIPVISAFSTKINFGQPLLLGLLSERNWFVISAALSIYYLLITKRIKFYELENIFVFIAVASLIIYCSFYFFVEPWANDDGVGFGKITESRGVRFHFVEFFIKFGLIYFFIKLFTFKKFSYLCLTLLFLSYIVFLNGGRTYLIVSLLVMACYFIFNAGLNRFIFYALVSSTVLAFSMSLFLLLMPDLLLSKVSFFAEMFNTVFSGKEGSDMSSNARIWTANTVIDYFTANPYAMLFGAGNVSNQFNDGWSTYFSYFYPSDIGWLGGFFQYGLFGIIFLWAYPTFMVLKLLHKTMKIDNDFINAIRYMLVFVLLTPQQSVPFFQIFTLLLPLFILFAFVENNEKENHVVCTTKS
ncbi:hypothetical protein L2755_08035 [Shewanella abyssi]|uniref:hypothetical protein n=1 Tax=Shewanella abyssi TaxID=311789 RepID=UPI00200D9451|nr:hypothetical protein [Shewanella abyssi]MCL1049565.1 hypothetical protein [Shewanella abyssi]